MDLRVEKSDSSERVATLRKLIRGGTASTQEELCAALREKKFDVTQSTVSRDLRRIGAIKAVNGEDEVIYVLPEDHLMMASRASLALDGLLTKIETNESMIVLHTTPGSASLVARHIDVRKRTIGVLGTIAGDDTIFVVPGSVKNIAATARMIRAEFSLFSDSRS